ncbi:class I SAM-dependent methyltransferase [Oxyplasma meridianum]|uniref:Class I SAM-dependent methyltransferase n=1 Tax=Oxyplasma meridianum TaxID=3073602 RepID=A0AAX4NE01_9ARCH
MDEDIKLYEVMSTLAPLIKGPAVLDVGTGFGTVIRYLIKNMDYNIVSIDPEAWTFQTLEKEYSSEIKDQRLKLLKSRAEDIPFPDNHFNSSIALFSMHHLKNPVEGMREMERVTCGRIFVAEWSRESAGKWNPHSEDQLSRVRESIGEFVENNGYETKDYGFWYLVYKTKE